MSVAVKLNSEIEYKGTMACLDGFMNIALENTVEYANEQQTNEYGDCFIRGNNGNLYPHQTVLFIALED